MYKLTSNRWLVISILCSFIIILSVSTIGCGGGNGNNQSEIIATLYGLTYSGTPPNGEELLVTIDPVNGTITTVGSCPNIDASAQGISALDANNHTIYFIGMQDNAPRLIVLSTETGAVLRSPSLTTASWSAIELD